MLCHRLILGCLGSNEVSPQTAIFRGLTSFDPGHPTLNFSCDKALGQDARRALDREGEASGAPPSRRILIAGTIASRDVPPGGPQLAKGWFPRRLASATLARSVARNLKRTLATIQGRGSDIRPLFSLHAACESQRLEETTVSSDAQRLATVRKLKLRKLKLRKLKLRKFAAPMERATSSILPAQLHLDSLGDVAHGKFNWVRFYANR